LKTRSNRFREKFEGELLESGKKKSLFKGIQFALSVLLNTVLFYILKENFISDDIVIRVFQIFGIVLVSVLASNFIALAIVMSVFNISSVRQFLTMEGSYTKFFAVTIIYSFVTSILFSFGVFTILYAAYGDGTTVTILLAYAMFYFIIEFFSYGLVSWAFVLTQNLKKQRGGE